LLSGVKVLVAEDEAVSRERLSTQLLDLGYEVVAVSDGQRALEVLESAEAPRLAVLEWSMPGLDGAEICRRLRARHDGHYTYATLLAAAQAPRDAAIDAGADDVLVKPVEVVELRARMQAGERILALQADLQRSRAYLDAVLGSIDSGVMLVDSEGRVVFANAILEGLLDRPAGALMGLSREEVMRAMIQRFDDSSTFVRALTPPEGIAVAPLMAEWEMQRPRRRVIRWSAHRVALGEGWGLLEICRDVTAESDVARGLREQAVRDPLTGQLNRRGGAEQLEREIARAHREQRPLAVAMVDADHFKQVNDRFGHDVGDSVLRSVATIMAEHLRAYDFVARWGGEEWLAVMPGATRADGVGIIERVRLAIEEARPPGLPSVTVSAGVDELRPGEGADSVIARADARLYQAKAAGRNRVV
jgi:two-component system cell cycle response regulator